MDKLTKLSQAIALGATIHEQCFGRLFTVKGHKEKIISTCALGAAYYAAFGVACKSTHEAKLKLMDRFKIPMEICDTVVQRNDTMRMSREDIARTLALEGY